MKFANLNFTKDEEFLRLIGIKHSTFNRILEILQQTELIKFYRGGKPNKLLLEDRILMTLEYWREYQTYFHIANSYGISETNCYRNIKWIEDTLIKNPEFQQLSGKKELIKEHFKDKTLIIDVTETPIQHPKKSQKCYYSGKKKKHTIKAQVIIEETSKKIITTHFSFGKKWFSLI